jgi:putative SOS response-associated peptidase YedK
MCGRFTSVTPSSELADFFDAASELADQDASFNVTPTSDIRVLREDDNGKRRLDLMFWGLVPSWAQDPAGASRMINARSETAASKPSFRSAFRRRRCIIPVDGFFEWVSHPERKKKQPVYISSKDSCPLAFAGIWETWQRTSDSGGLERLTSCAILTGPPNELIAPLHDRMPMILGRDQWSGWLDRTTDDVEHLQAMLRPAPEDWLQWWPVSLRVNSVRNNDAKLIEASAVTPDGEAEGQERLL